MPKFYASEALLTEDGDRRFGLIGRGNMRWATAFAKPRGVHIVYVSRKYHEAVAAATASNVTIGKVAVFARL
jgi:hypothetical protein